MKNTEKEIKLLVKNYLNSNPTKINGCPASGKLYDNEELENLIKASLEGWWTDSKWVTMFEQDLGKFIGRKFVHTCNSGSSANLLAFAALCSPMLGKKQICPGDEVITVAAGFPTTINPIIQNNCIPVFLDVKIGNYNIDVSQLEKAISKKTKAVMIAHTLGNPFNLSAITQFCKKYDLWLIEDNCDALGTKYKGRYTGTFGDISTISFYPAHHITTAEGGVVLTDNPVLSRIICSIRDWGRHCWCPTGKDNTCKQRFKWKLGDLPEGYDHKYIYSEIGYNLKMSDLHAAIGVAQIKKLNSFIEKRKNNFSYLYNEFKKFKDYFILPEGTENAEVSWFGFPLTIKDSKINRADLMQYLSDNKVGSRLLFAGNIIKQPYFIKNKIKFKKIGDLKNTDLILTNTFWIGLYPGLDKGKLKYIINIFKKYIKK